MIMSNTPVTPDKPRNKWQLKTLIEILPILVALTVFFSYTTIKKVPGTTLVTPLTEVLGVVPIWVTILMGLITLVGFSGMAWLLYLFSRAPISPDGSSDEVEFDGSR